MSEIKSKIGLTPKGAYSSSTTYDYLDYVTNADGTYTSKQANNVGHALTETDWWEHDFISPKMRVNATTKNWEVSYDGGTTYIDTGISSKGEKGDKGDIGAQGAQGLQGIQGLQGATGDKGEDEFDGIQNVSGTDVTMQINPNILYIFGTMTSLNLTLATPTDSTRVNEYMIQFISGATPTTLTLPSIVKWIGSNYISASKTYQISIVNNLAVLEVS